MRASTDLAQTGPYNGKRWLPSSSLVGPLLLEGHECSASTSVHRHESEHRASPFQAAL